MSHQIHTTSNFIVSRVGTQVCFNKTPAGHTYLVTELKQLQLLQWVLMLSLGTREITRLDITMQPLIQPILCQIIDTCFYFPEKFSDFSCWKYPQELQLLHMKTSYHLNKVFGQTFTRNAKNGFACLKLIWSGTFAIFNTEPLWFWFRVGSRVKISH